MTRSRLEILAATATFVATLALRVHGVSAHFWLLGDQMRDWAYALGPFRELPLVGPPTHVHGYTIGPAFYWILWAIRVTVGPWFQNLPHAGGIGQAILQSAADALLLIAVWRRTSSIWIALAAAVLLTTASYDLALAALIWNPVAGSTLAKTATALVLLGWTRDPGRAAVVAALAWAAVHAYTGAIFVAVAVFAAIVVDPIARRDWRGAVRAAVIVLAVVAVLQVPYCIHQVQTRFHDPAMGVVTGGVGDILRGSATPEIGKSVRGYVQAVAFIEGAPWALPYVGWALAICAVIVAVRFRRDPVLLAILLLPQIAAVAGYALFLGDVEPYYYLSLMPAAVITILLAATSVMPRGSGAIAAIALLAIAVAAVPPRIRFAATMHRLPEYETLVTAGRKLVRINRPIRFIVADFGLPPTTDPVFIYNILGGRLDPAAPWVAVIERDGRVEFRKN